MSFIDQRTALERLIRERREDYAGLSRLIGRNPAYIQQFIKRGTPRKLDSGDVAVLARYFGVDELQLGARGAADAARAEALVRVPRLDVGASAGPGALNEDDVALSPIGFDRAWLRRLCGGGGSELSLIAVRGDSMSPTLNDGDDILVQGTDSAERLRDGIYVLRREGALLVKRVAINPASHLVTIKSDNPAYPEWRDCDMSSMEVLGRVVWAGRRVS